MYLSSRSSLIYIGDFRVLAVCFHLMGFYSLICNRLVVDLGSFIVLLISDILGEVCKIACQTRGFNVLYSWIFIAVVYVVIVVVRV